VGTDYCRFGLGESIGLALKIENLFQGLDTPHKLKAATAGCPRNCSEAMVKDIGAVAVEGGKWEIYVGGAAGSTVRKGDILCVVDTEEDVLTYMGRFVQYYRENAKYLERTHGFVQRLGIDKLRAIVVDDSEGIVERLDAEMAASKASYKDPWKEAWMQATPNQFASELRVIS
jgi:nitrite reductase (NADH) large subunit